MITKERIKKQLYLKDSPFEKRITFSKYAIETYTNLVTFENDDKVCFCLTENLNDDKFSFICIVQEKEKNIFMSDLIDVFRMLLLYNFVDNKKEIR